MNMKQYSRRHFLRASGITLGLPWLEAFAGAAPSQTPPKRFCAIYFPYGVSLPGEQHEHAKWNWFPSKTGRDFQFGESLKSLSKLRDQVSVLGGLHHPKMAGGGGHDSADTFLTAAALRNNNLKNSVSLDQVMAKQLGGQTRFSSLVFSTDGGVGIPTRSNTLSYSEDGQPIPSLNRPAFIFERLFGLNKDSIEAQRRGFAVTGSHLDLLLDEARTLNAKLGKADQEKLDQYLTSVREVEQQVQRSADLLDVPKPQVNASGLTLDADDKTPKELIRTMLDLLVLAFQTDSTRFATYQLASMHGATSIAVKFSQLLGFGNNTHGLAHAWNKIGGAEKLGKWDQWQAENLTYFLDKLAAVKEGNGTLLDNTCVLYGSSNSTTHTNLNYPLILAGGRNLGLKHGEHRRFDKTVPLSNLYLTLLHRMGIEQEKFADSTGEMTELLG
jgi:hypothetical protein